MSGEEPKSKHVQHGATGRSNIFAARDPIDRFLRSRNELSQRQRNAVELLLRGLSDQDVAAQLGVDRTTIFRWRKSIAFQRELDRQRRALWEQSAGKIQSMVEPALAILHGQLTSSDPKLAMRAAAVLLRFATPSRLAPGALLSSSSSSPDAPGKTSNSDKQYVDDLLAYVDAPMPGQPGAPEDMGEEDGTDEEAKDEPED